MKFYIAYAIRTMANPHTIQKDKYYTNYSEAEEKALKMLNGDDDAGVFIRYKKEWYRVWGEDGGRLVISKYLENYDNSIKIFTSIKL